MMKLPQAQANAVKELALPAYKLFIVFKALVIGFLLDAKNQNVLGFFTLEKPFEVSGCSFSENLRLSL